MGSISSRPSAPSQPAVVFVPAPMPAPTPSPAPAQTTNTDSTPSVEETQSQQRTNDLLRRGRGRFGTVLTGFRGLLSSSDKAASRKTLLGE